MASNQSTTVSEDTAPFTYANQVFHTYYKVVGDLLSGTPLVVIHGGPSFAHDYLLPLSGLSASHGVPVVFYDQLGNGRSFHRAPPEFWSMAVLVAQLSALLEHLGLGSREDGKMEYDFLGHSFGGILAMEFILRTNAQARGLRRLVLANTHACTPDREAVQARLRSHLPPEILKTIQEGEKRGASVTDDSEVGYKEAMTLWFERHVCRVRPIPSVIWEMFGLARRNPDVLPGLKASDYTPQWDIRSRLHEITAPTLLISGAHDFLDDTLHASIFKGLGGKVKWVRLSESSHYPFWEAEAEVWMREVGGFLRML